MKPDARQPPHPSNANLPEIPSRAVSQRLAFLAIDEADRQRLRELAPQLKEQATQFVETFYQHLFAFEETARFLQDPALVARLKQSQQAHLESMLAANWDEAYAERRFRVGDVHAQVGINPEIFLGAYNQYLQFSVRHLATSFDESARECAEQVLSLQKAVFLDIGLTLEAYFAQSTQSLRQALDLLYRANSDLRQFAHLTSHDLKTPLATMANLCDEALDEFRDQMPAEAARLIEAARNRSFSMSQTIDELLSSTMSLHTEQAWTAISSEQVVAKAVERLGALLDQKNIELTIAQGMPPVLGDPARLGEVFFNLLTNAVKFIDKRKGRIAIDFATRDDECIFEVRDNGPGIPAEELDRVFVPFRRLPSHRDIPGSGLGLYFTKAMIEQQNGRVWVESEPGAGSSFFILLKLAKPNA
ncbi:MAG: protoglobin domain-containing protein [Pirellulales bacterium]